MIPSQRQHINFNFPTDYSLHIELSLTLSQLM